jgi:hypothetical protein
MMSARNSVCAECGEALEQRRFGRRRIFHKACKKRVEKRRERENRRVSPPVSPPRRDHFTPISPREQPLSRAEQEALLGRPLADGLTWAQYRELTGDNLSPGGFMRE